MSTRTLQGPPPDEKHPATRQLTDETRVNSHGSSWSAAHDPLGDRRLLVGSPTRTFFRAFKRWFVCRQAFRSNDGIAVEDGEQLMMHLQALACRVSVPRLVAPGPTLDSRGAVQGRPAAPDHCLLRPWRFWSSLAVA